MDTTEKGEDEFKQLKDCAIVHGLTAPVSHLFMNEDWADIPLELALQYVRVLARAA